MMIFRCWLRKRAPIVALGLSFRPIIRIQVRHGIHVRKNGKNFRPNWVSASKNIFFFFQWSYWHKKGKQPYSIIPSFSTTTTEDGSTAGTAEENWLQLELEMLERMSVRTQTLEEIMAEVLLIH
jgi:hypothetical protein